MPKLGPDGVIVFILAELDRVALAHNTFTEDALALIVRLTEGVLRAARDLRWRARGRIAQRRNSPARLGDTREPSVRVVLKAKDATNGG